MLRIADSFGSHDRTINVGRKVFPYLLDTADYRNTLPRSGLVLVEPEDIAP